MTEKVTEYFSKLGKTTLTCKIQSLNKSANLKVHST